MLTTATSLLLLGTLALANNSLTGDGGWKLIPSLSTDGLSGSQLLASSQVINILPRNGSRETHGHFVTSPDLSMFSVYPPIAGCGYGVTTTSAEARYRGCAAAMNLGFFDISNTTNPHCLGAVVSDGQYIESDATGTIHFGTTSDGNWFIGYVDDDLLSQHTVELKNRCVAQGYCPPNNGSDWFFTNLASGQIQLVNDRQNFVNESKPAGNSTFKSELAGRTAIGVLQDGSLGMVQIDGATGYSGISLYDLGDLMISLNFTDAINLDGGGSSTTALNGVLVSSPGDRCTGSANATLFGCERKVSTIVCVHSSPQQFLNGAI